MHTHGPEKPSPPSSNRSNSKRAPQNRGGNSQASGSSHPHRHHQPNRRQKQVTPSPESRPIIEAEVTRNEKSIMIDLDKIPRVVVCPPRPSQDPATSGKGGVEKQTLRLPNACGRAVPRVGPIEVAVHMLVRGAPAASTSRSPPHASVLFNTRDYSSDPVAMVLGEGENPVGVEEGIRSLTETELALLTIYPPYNITPILSREIISSGGSSSSSSSSSSSGNSSCSSNGSSGIWMATWGESSSSPPPLVQVARYAKLEVEVEVMLINFKGERLGIRRPFVGE
eukprot:jgi/Bigna1/143763/aug1.81_g18471